MAEPSFLSPRSRSRLLSGGTPKTERASGGWGSRSALASSGVRDAWRRGADIVSGRAISPVNLSLALERATPTLELPGAQRNSEMYGRLDEEEAKESSLESFNTDLSKEIEEIQATDNEPGKSILTSSGTLLTGSEIKPRSNDLDSEIRCLSKELEIKNAELKGLRQQLHIYTGTSDQYGKLTVKDLRTSLKNLEIGISKIRAELAIRSSTGSTCVVCHETDRCIVLMPCKHLCLCSECSQSVKEKCPLCRVRIESKMRVYA